MSLSLNPEIVHHRTNLCFNLLISGHDSVNPLREAISVLSGKDKRFRYPQGDYLGSIHAGCPSDIFGSKFSLSLIGFWVKRKFFSKSDNSRLNLTKKFASEDNFQKFLQNLEGIYSDFGYFWSTDRDLTILLGQIFESWMDFPYVKLLSAPPGRYPGGGGGEAIKNFCFDQLYCIENC